MSDADVARVVEYLEATTITVHHTVEGWPMVGIFRPGPPGPAAPNLIETWQAREVGNLLQTIGERMNRAADGVEVARAMLLKHEQAG